MKEMKKYYFTFGEHKDFPYQGGYITIKATSYDEARDVFQQLFGVKNNCLPFSEQYTEEEWQAIYQKWVNQYGERYAKRFLGPCHDEF